MDFYAYRHDSELETFELSWWYQTTFAQVAQKCHIGILTIFLCYVKWSENEWEKANKNGLLLS